jgi:signal transduction histidine kinase/CheY-like chemotaxis protein
VNAPAIDPPSPSQGLPLPVVASLGVLLLVLAGTYMVFHNERSYRDTKTQQIDAQAAILASTVAPAIEFDDAKAAQEYVNALASDAGVDEAAVYDAQGNLLAGYSREGVRPSPPELARAGHRITNDRILSILPVRRGPAVIGTVYVRSVIEPLARRLERYAAIAAVYLMAILSFVVLARTQRSLRRKNTELARVNEALLAEASERGKAESALRQSQKMEAIGQLTGGIAHDFNNLLQVIAGNLEMLKRRDLAPGDDTRRMLDAAMRGAERASTLTSRLLAFARRQPLVPRAIDANRLVTGMSELLRRVLGEEIVVETVLAAGLWRAHADANQLENALVNLVVNARDAMARGGKLTIETANTVLDEACAAAQGTTPGPYVMIAVSDTGTGMSRDVQEHAFEPFFTTKGIGKGTGLGLSQVYGYVRQSGGHARIVSEPGKGTTISLYLPRMTGEVDATGAAPARAPAGTDLRDRPILVVEDDEGVRAFVVAGLTELGYPVRVAPDAATALRMLEADAGVGLLFTDIGLPGGMDGRELADAAMRHWPGLPVLFTTAYARDAIVHHGRLDAGVELITKPFTLHDLAARVERVLASDAAQAFWSRHRTAAP